MSLSEFQLIKKYFYSTPPHSSGVVIGVGDDGAVIKLPPDTTRVGVCETITTHSPNINTDHPKALGHRVLSTALNKLAAFGATPAWMTLSLTLPEANESWLQPFSEGLLSLAERFRISLVGGDTTQGPLTITVIVDGTIPIATPSPANPGVQDALCMSGFLAGSANALIATSTPHLFTDTERRQALHELEFPTPRVVLGKFLSEHSVAAADITGGLTAGIKTLLERSELGGELHLDKLPVPNAVSRQMALAPGYRPWLSLTGDHELVFTLPCSQHSLLTKKLAKLGIPISIIGSVDEGAGVRLRETS